MSEFTAISAVSQTLHDLLKAHITDSTDPQLNGVPIDLRSPREMRDDNDALGISLWLYRVTRNGDILNQPPVRPGPHQALRRPLPVNLHYLVTPLSKDTKSEQALLGRALQVFHDHAALRGSDLRDSLQGEPEELRLTLETLSLEELTRVWNSLQESYQLSVSYLVQVVTIDSDHEPVETSPVVVRESRYTQVLSVR